jgi:hypothetical protein
MILHPDVQRKGQEEISQVCDSSQLPSYDDVDSLPYVTAIALEVLRWTSPVPIGIASSRFWFEPVLFAHLYRLTSLHRYRRHLQWIPRSWAILGDC